MVKAIVSGLLLIAAPAFAAGNGGDANGEGVTKYTICHVTESASNPFVVIYTDNNAVANAHERHHDGRDLVVPMVVPESYFMVVDGACVPAQDS